MKLRIFPLLSIVAAAALAGCSQPLLSKGPNDQFEGFPTKWQPSAVKPKAAAPNDLGLQPQLKNPMSLAQLADRRGEYEQAEKLYREIIRRNPNDGEPYHCLAVMYSKQGKFKEADSCFERAMTLKPGDARLLNDAGYFYYLASRNPDAERCLRQAVEKEPGNASYCNNLALVLGEQGRYDEAYALFRRGGSELDAQSNMGYVFSQRGEYKKAMDAYNRVLTADPKSRTAAEAMIQLAQLEKRTRSSKPAGKSPETAVAQRQTPAESPAAPQQPIAEKPLFAMPDAPQVAERPSASPVEPPAGVKTVAANPPAPPQSVLTPASPVAPVAPAASVALRQPQLTIDRPEPREQTASAPVTPLAKPYPEPERKSPTDGKGPAVSPATQQSLAQLMEPGNTAPAAPAPPAPRPIAKPAKSEGDMGFLVGLLPENQPGKAEIAPTGANEPAGYVDVDDATAKK